MLKDIVFFDLDGVLLDSESDLSWLKYSIEKTLHKFHIIPIKENIIKLYPTNISQFINLTKSFQINQEDLWNTRNKYYIQEKIYAMKSRKIQPYPDVSGLFELKRNYFMGIISNSPQEIVDFFIKEFGYSDIFRWSIGRGPTLHDLQNLKPNPYLFKQVQKLIPRRPTIYIGDTEKDREFAYKTGMKFLLLSRHNREDGGFNTLHDVVRYLMKKEIS